MDDLYDDYGLSPFGEDTGGVLPDVSNGAPDEQPTTPTGTGTGYYIPPAWESGLLGGLTSALNAAIKKDQAKTQQQTMVTAANTSMAMTQQRARITNQRLLLLGGLALVAFLIVEH